jgi:hypothetical protein
MHPAAGTDLIDVSYYITNPVMIQINPVLEIGSITIICVMNSLKKLSPQKNSKLDGVNFIILVPIAGY